MTNASARAWVAGVALGLLSRVLGLRPTASPAPPTFYSLDGQPGTPAAPRQAAHTDLTLIVNEAHAASGFESQRIIYVRTPHKREYFAQQRMGRPACEHDHSADRQPASVDRRLSGRGRGARAAPAASCASKRSCFSCSRNLRPNRARCVLRCAPTSRKTRHAAWWRHATSRRWRRRRPDPYGGVRRPTRLCSVLAEVAEFCYPDRGGLEETFRHRAPLGPAPTAGVPRSGDVNSLNRSVSGLRSHRSSVISLGGFEVLHVGRCHLRGEFAPEDDRVDLVVVERTAPVEIARADRRPHAVDERGLGVQQRAAPLVDLHAALRAAPRSASGPRGRPRPNRSGSGRMSFTSTPRAPPHRSALSSNCGSGTK